MGMFYGSLRHDVTGRKKRNYARKTKTSIRGVFMSLNEIVSAGSVPEYPSCPDTAGVAARVESPCVIREPSSKVSEQCTNPMRYQLSTKKK